MTREEIINKANCILVDNRGLKEVTPLENIVSIDDFLKDRPYLKIGSNNPQDGYINTPDAHHYTTAFWRDQYPRIMKYLDIPFNPKDFFIQQNIIENYDLSYLRPFYSPFFKVIANQEELDKNGNIIIHKLGYESYERYEDMVQCDSDEKPLLQHFEHWKYHSLFKYAHTSAIIENLSIKNNDRTLIISSNSHSIPCTPIFCYYYKKVIILDARYENASELSFEQLYCNEEPDKTDSLLMISYDTDINKFLINNF